MSYEKEKILSRLTKNQESRRGWSISFTKISLIISGCMFISGISLLFWQAPTNFDRAMSSHMETFKDFQESDTEVDVRVELEDDRISVKRTSRNQDVVGRMAARISLLNTQAFVPPILIVGSILILVITLLIGAIRILFTLFHRLRGKL